MDHLVLIRYVKICENPIAIVIMSTSTARRNMYKYSVSLMIQIYKLFKITLLSNDQNSKGYAEVQTFHTSVPAKLLQD
jgi:vancomycin permeability regulator SanA